MSESHSVKHDRNSWLSEGMIPLEDASDASRFFGNGSGAPSCSDHVTKQPVGSSLIRVLFRRSLQQ